MYPEDWHLKRCKSDVSTPLRLATVCQSDQYTPNLGTRCHSDECTPKIGVRVINVPQVWQLCVKVMYVRLATWCHSDECTPKIGNTVSE